MTDRQIRKTYSEEFKKDAVALVTQQNYKVAEAARSLGISTAVLHRWKQDETTGKALSEEERDELKRLRRENSMLKMEKDILKKASAYFAKHIK